MGNSITARRYSRILRSLGHPTRVVRSSDAVADAGLLVALHAHKSAAAVAAFRRKFPARPIVVVLTGTDLYGRLGLSRSARRALEAADAVVTLQAAAIARLPAAVRKKAVAAVQSAQRPPIARKRRARAPVRFAVIGHLRREKDPLRAAFALRHVQHRNVAVVQAGTMLDRRYAGRATGIQTRDRRYRYLGEVSHGRALRLLAGCDALVISSRCEGGANVASEAIACGVAVLASRIEGNVGVFGRKYAGYYAAGSSRALAKLMDRFAIDPFFAATLQRQIRALRPTVTPQRERACLARAIALALANAKKREAGGP